MRANRPDIETGFDQLKSKTVRCFRTSRHNRLAFKFLCPSTANADHMVMVTVVGHSQLEAPTTLGELKLLQKPHISQQAQGAVDRRQGDL